MKKVLIVSILFIAMINLYGCSNAYESNGTVTVKNAKGNKVSYQIAEIGTNSDGKTCVYIQGTKAADGKETSVCAYVMSGVDFDWDIYVGASITVDGTVYDALSTTPYLATLPGNLVCFEYDTDQTPDTITVFHSDNQQGGVSVNVAKLALEPVPYCQGLSTKVNYEPNTGE
ncbi:MAG: hypothetical protein ACOYU3_10225 [Bacillota bacterium]